MVQIKKLGLYLLLAVLLVASVSASCTDSDLGTTKTEYGYAQITGMPKLWDACGSYIDGYFVSSTSGDVLRERYCKTDSVIGTQETDCDCMNGVCQEFVDWVPDSTVYYCPPYYYAQSVPCASNDILPGDLVNTGDYCSPNGKELACTSWGEPGTITCASNKWGTCLRGRVEVIDNTLIGKVKDFVENAIDDISSAGDLVSSILSVLKIVIIIMVLVALMPILFVVVGLFAGVIAIIRRLFR